MMVTGWLVSIMFSRGRARLLDSLEVAHACARGLGDDSPIGLWLALSQSVGSGVRRRACLRVAYAIEMGVAS